MQRRGPPGERGRPLWPRRARGAGSRRPPPSWLRPVHRTLPSASTSTVPNGRPGLERFAGQRHTRPQVRPGPAPRWACGQPALERVLVRGLVCRACNRCGSSSGPPATSGAARCTRSSAVTTWSSSASTPTARTRSGGTRPSCAAGRSRPACWRPTTSRRCWRWGRTPAATTRCGRASTSWSRCWRPASTSAPAQRGSPAASRATSDRSRIVDACERGQSTIFGSGAHPGMTNLVAMALSGSCERVDSVVITESVDCSTYESAGTQIAMGFSQPPDTPGLAEAVRSESEVFAESAAMMADAMGVVLDRLTFDVDLHRGHGRQRPGLHDDPGGDRRRRDGLPPRLGGGAERRQRRLQLGHGPAHGAAQAARARPRDPGLRAAQHAHGAALPPAGGLDRAGLHGARA